MGEKPHAIFFPYPLQGHIIPAVHLATKLAAGGLAITFVNTEAIHHQTSTAHGGTISDIFAVARRVSGLDINYEVISDGLPISFDRSLNHDQFMESLIHVYSAHAEELVRKVNAGGDHVACIIADTFFVWPATLARKIGVPYVSFWTEPALIFTLYYHMDLLRQNGHFACLDKREDEVTYIPGVPKIEPKDLMSYLQETQTDTVVHQLIFKAFEDAKGADFVLCNTVEELEPTTISALRRQKKFYAIGPIFPPGFTKSSIATSLWAESDCVQWLNSQLPRSVLYISFGSYAHISKRELEEIAYGVLNSNVSFIWVLRPDMVSSDDPEPLPKEFENRTQGRGLVVQWCCQIEVLSHASIGGFLTHCGWNSILESIWSEIPLLCFPLLTDQFTNRKLVVDDWKIGANLSCNGKVINRSEVCEKIKGFMRGKVGEECKKKIKEVRRILENATKDGGSSQRNFDIFMEDLANSVPKRKQVITNGFMKHF